MAWGAVSFPHKLPSPCCEGTDQRWAWVQGSLWLSGGVCGVWEAQGGTQPPPHVWRPQPPQRADQEGRVGVGVPRVDTARVPAKQFSWASDSRQLVSRILTCTFLPYFMDSTKYVSPVFSISELRKAFSVPKLLGRLTEWRFGVSEMWLSYL